VEVCALRVLQLRLQLSFCIDGLKTFPATAELIDANTANGNATVGLLHAQSKAEIPLRLTRCELRE